MKLIMCKKCGDVYSLSKETKTCTCGSSWGEYIDGINAKYGGESIMLGFSNSSFTRALRECQPNNVMGTEFTAFVIPESSPTIIKGDDEYV